MLESTEAPQSNKSHKVMLQPMGLAGILDTALSLYRRNFGVFFGIAALYFVLIAAQEFLVVFLLEKSDTPNLEGFISDVDVVLDGFIGMLNVGILVVACSEIYLGGPVTIQIALRRFSSRFLGYLGASLIYLFVGYMWMLDSLGDSSLVNLFRIGFFPFLCFYLISWVFYGPVVLLEEPIAVQALGRSKGLVRGTWRRVFGIVLAITLFCLAIDYILGSSFGVILALFGVVRDGSLMETVRSLFGMKYIFDRPTSVDTSIMYLVYLAVETFSLPIYGIGVTLLYFDLRIRKEAFDIEMRAQSRAHSTQGLM